MRFRCFLYLQCVYFLYFIHQYTSTQQHPVKDHLNVVIIQVLSAFSFFPRSHVYKMHMMHMVNLTVLGFYRHVFQCSDSGKPSGDLPVRLPGQVLHATLQQWEFMELHSEQQSTAQPLYCQGVFDAITMGEAQMKGSPSASSFVTGVTMNHKYREQA